MLFLNISMYRIPFLNSDCTETKEKMDQLRLGEEEELGAWENILIVLHALQRGRFSVYEKWATFHYIC